jgi:hypothetical protein
MNTIKPALATEPGDLWLMIQLDDHWFRDDSDCALLDRVVAYVEDHDLGVWDGQSSGAGAMDVSFTVGNQQLAAQRLDAFFRQHAPTVRYYISDHYEFLFDRLSDDETSASGEAERM